MGESARSSNINEDHDLHGDPILLDNVPKTITVRGNGPKAKEPQCRVATVGRRQNGSAERRVPRVGEDRRELVRCCWSGGRVFRRGVEISVQLALDETVKSVEVPVLTQTLATLPRQLDVSLACPLQRGDLMGGSRL